MGRQDGFADEELTDGYARALFLEAECRSLRRRIRGVAAEHGDEIGGRPSQRELTERLGALQSELRELRTALDRKRRALDPRGRLY
jgi:hypothetical protein